jgi:hypothetical protein
MKVRYIILISVLTLIVGYLIGQIIPWDWLHPTISDTTITMNDYYTRLISVVGALATLFATFVALFKEDIKKLYEYASLEVMFKDQNILSEVLDIETTTSSTQNISAKKYEVIILINNSGKLAARGCQVYLESISFKHSTFPAPKDMPITGKPLQWIGKAETSVIIPSKAKGFINLFEILSPKSEIVTEERSQQADGKAQIAISGSDLFLEDFNGTYKCVFMIYSENTSPVEFELVITWNGNWRQRLTEMKDCITIKSTSAKKR